MVFIEAASQLTTKEFQDILNKSENGFYEVNLTINGKEVSFFKVMSLIDSCLDKLVNKKATEILDEKIFDICGFLEELKKNAEIKLNSIKG